MALRHGVRRMRDMNIERSDGRPESLIALAEEERKRRSGLGSLWQLPVPADLARYSIVLGT